MCRDKIEQGGDRREVKREGNKEKTRKGTEKREQTKFFPPAT
jgi:hypothetical protein